jgi:hypothetical protein
MSIDAGILREHVQVIRSKIGQELIQKWRDVQNEPIWANFWKEAKGIVSKPFFQTPLLFFDIDCSIFKTHYKEYTLIWLKDI